MAVKLPAHWVFFRNGVSPLTEPGKYNSLSDQPEKMDKLKELLSKYGELEFYEDTIDVEHPIKLDHFTISGYEEIIKRPKEPEKLKELVLRVHGEIKNSPVFAEVYDWMGSCFEEMGIEIEDNDLKTAVTAAREVTRRSYRMGEDTSPLINFNADSEAKMYQERFRRKERE